jgi:hypothetical protein
MTTTVTMKTERLALLVSNAFTLFYFIALIARFDLIAHLAISIFTLYK